MAGEDRVARGMPILRDGDAADLEAIHALNQANDPHVNALSPEALRAIVAESALLRVATVDGEVVAFVLALAPRADYASANFRWFRERYAAFLYVDRIAVELRQRGRGIGAMLYDAVEARAVALGMPLIACEVNLRPPNPESLAFHAHRGFVEVGRQDTEGGAKTVALLAKHVGA